MLHPAIYNTSELCFAVGVRHAVMSPGSRNAPLIISFARNDKIKKWIIPDERSAGFIALGIAQKRKEPVVLCCTSGTALLNYAPAIAEAYYREILVIVLSADRPPELIDQRDGQTIRQFEALKNHVKFSTKLPVIETKQDADDYTAELIHALTLTQNLPLAPIHINIPFKEPFYPSKDQKLTFSAIDFHPPNSQVSKFTLTGTSYSKVLILVGQQSYDQELSHELKKLEEKLPVLYSPLNNLGSIGIRYVDTFIQDQSELRPELLITSGLSLLSKRLKKYLKKNKPNEHWHFDPAGVEVDTFQTNPRIFKFSLADFLKKYSFSYLNQTFLSNWLALAKRAENKISAFSFDIFSEISAFKTVLSRLPSGIDLHLSNSMPVRLAEIFGTKNENETWSNRGTSGIDGVTSTAIGSAFVSKKLNVLLTGDLSFLYDRNAFFHNHSYANFHIIVFNNSGGGIFRLIEGPSDLPEFEDYFETRHNRTARYICNEYSINYNAANNFDELSGELVDFFNKSSNPKLLEVFTDSKINEEQYARLMKCIKDAT